MIMFLNLKDYFHSRGSKYEQLVIYKKQESRYHLVK